MALRPNPPRILDAIGVVAVLSAIPLWSSVHPAVSVFSLVIGALLVFVEPAAMTTRPTIWSWTFRLSGLVLAVSAVSIWLRAGPILAVPLLVVGLALTVLGSVLKPLPETGSHFARFTMEAYDDSRMVKPPRENVLDPLENDDGRFLGR